MIYISHKMEEFKKIGDRVAVLRDGKTIGDAIPISEITLDEIMQTVGRDIKDMFPKEKTKLGNKIMEIKNFNVDHFLY